MKKIHSKGGHMETNKIRAVLAAAKYKSFSRAAEEFSYTPSAFSHMIGALEDGFGLRLFSRSSRGVELTPEGMVLLPKLQALLDSEEDLMNTASEHVTGQTRVLRIGTYSSISRSLLASLLKQFKKTYPDVKLSIRVADDLRGWLDDGRADVILADELICRSYMWVPILEDRYLAVASPKLLNGSHTVTREELYRLPHIYTDDEYLEAYFERERFEELIYFNSVDDLSILHMVKEQMGVAVLPELLLKGVSESVALFPLDPPVTRTLGFAYKKQRSYPYALKCFLNTVKKAL